MKTVRQTNQFKSQHLPSVNLSLIFGVCYHLPWKTVANDGIQGKNGGIHELPPSSTPQLEANAGKLWQIP